MSSVCSQYIIYIFHSNICDRDILGYVAVYFGRGIPTFWFFPEDSGGMLLRNAAVRLSGYTAP